MTDQLLEDLVATRHALVERGRCAFDFVQPGSGKVCLDGAIGIATIPNYGELDNGSMGQYSALLESPRAQDVMRAIKDVLPEGFAQFTIPGTDQEKLAAVCWSFNDDYRTTDQDVLDALDRAVVAVGGSDQYEL